MGKKGNAVYWLASARSLRRAIFLAAAPRRRAPVGTVARVAPLAPVKTRPPAVVKDAAATASGRKKIGWATLMLSRQTARVTANKPWGGNF